MHESYKVNREKYSAILTNAEKPQNEGNKL